MRKLLTILLASLFVSGCPFTPSDDEKLNELNNRCEKFASEEILDNSADGEILLSNYYSELEENSQNQHKINKTKGISSEVKNPIGFANLPALDIEYNPPHLLKTLLIGKDKLTEVVYPTSAYYKSKLIECPPYKYVYVHNAEEALDVFNAVCKKEHAVELSDKVRYVITYAYGKPDSYDIRSFVFKITDRLNGRVLAIQKSYQLLWGGMKNKENRALLDWGGAQGVKNCSLTPPDQVVKRVIR